VRVGHGGGSVKGMSQNVAIRVLSESASYWIPNRMPGRMPTSSPILSTAHDVLDLSEGSACLL